MKVVGTIASGVWRFIRSLPSTPSVARDGEGDAPAMSWEESAAQAIAQQQQARTVAAPRQTAARAEVQPRVGVVGARRQFGVRK